MEILDGSTTAKALGFKLDFWARPIVNELKKKAKHKERQASAENNKKEKKVEEAKTVELSTKD